MPCIGCQFLRHYFIIYYFTWPWAWKTSFISQLCCSWLWPLCQDISAVTDPKSISLQTSHKKQPLVPKEINQFSKERFFTWPYFEIEGFENTNKWLSVVLLSWGCTGEVANHKRSIHYTSWLPSVAHLPKCNHNSYCIYTLRRLPLYCLTT